MKVESYYMYFYSCYLVCLQIFKILGGLRYPPHIWGMEFAAIIFFCFIQAQRINLGMTANRNENHGALFIFWVFTLIAVLMYLYFATFTTYVLVIDIAAGSVGIVLSALEFLIGIVAALYIRRKNQLV